MPHTIYNHVLTGRNPCINTAIHMLLIHGFAVLRISIPVPSQVKEPGHEKTCLMSYADNKGADQPAHPRSLISTFVVRCPDSVMSLVCVIKISSLMLASVAAQAGLCLAWSETPEDTFCRVVAQINTCKTSRYLLVKRYLNFSCS